MDLYERLQQRYPKNFETCYDFSSPEGWDDIVEKLTGMVVALQPDIKIQQVKEKFGGLRYYVDSATEEVNFLIETAEDASERTCQVCGQPGGMVEKNYWVATLCEKHK